MRRCVAGGVKITGDAKLKPGQARHASRGQVSTLIDTVSKRTQVPPTTVGIQGRATPRFGECWLLCHLCHVVLSVELQVLYCRAGYALGVL